MPIAATMAICILIIGLALSLRDKWINGRVDLSYGIYIYAFPTQQIVINLISTQFWLSLAITLLLTLIMAYLSYRFIEKPCLNFSSAKKAVPTCLFVLLVSSPIVIS